MEGKENCGVSPDSGSRSRLRRCQCMVAVAALLYLGATACFIRQVGVHPFINHGGAFALQEGARAFWEHGTLAAESFRKMHEDAVAQSTACGCGYWQDVYAMGVDGQHYPARAIILAVIAAPFVGVGGEFGLWLLNSVLFIGIATAFFTLCMLKTSVRPALCATVLLICGTSLSGYDYGIHYDLWAIFLLLISLVLVDRHQLIAGLLVALMTEIRPTHLLFLPLLCCAVGHGQGERSVRRVGRVAQGAMLGLLVVGAINFSLWGLPWTTGFQRMLNYDSGSFVFYKLHTRLDLNELFSDWLSKLFDPRLGVLCTNPVVILGIIGFISYNSWPRGWKLATMVVSIVHLLIFASDQTWTNHGNLVRYLIPDAVVLSLGMAALFEALPIIKGSR